jgi:hypothetical protein
MAAVLSQSVRKRERYAAIEMLVCVTPVIGARSKGSGSARRALSCIVVPQSILTLKIVTHLNRTLKIYRGIVLIYIYTYKTPLAC